MKNGDKPARPTNARMHSDMVGLTKREYFAGLAMQGMLANPSVTVELEKCSDGIYKKYAVLAIRCSDALLEELDKGGDK